jgi:hypothetical protein
MLFRETIAIILRLIRNSYVHYVGKMQSFSMLKQTVHTTQWALKG